ncbi:GlsB/YeaQ/YmgE family stress response membrane protein [Nordella sp. HKS 07]|uniref:GlsB/YeaQ/YmgE family stress response membrane protein n=1 Tax=Nordella sp. HKS 07 TaxID=2712222 RepID=UPI0013E1F2FF|nr:GlsB/YeaQ/YmgE family stress response membrane protein [Nordella sp. HKS 07]QIG50876.1 GlsB/YeaQ/YmgE family stress response membrane protein [Nordella sp. HKS 07]
MEGFGWFMTIVLGAIAGWLAEKVMKFDTGLIMNIVLGIVGAVLGNVLLRALGMTFAGSIPGQLIIAVIGACILIYVYRLIKSSQA